jgi:hypothetical protein
MRKKTQAFTLENEVIEAVEKQAIKEDRSKSNIVNGILKKFFGLDKEKE